MASRPGPALRRLLGVPAALYRADAGWLLGHRFLMLTHRGRRSGRLYQAVLEVLCWDGDREEAIVMSGFGPGAQWYAPAIRQLDVEEAALALAGYERRHRLLTPIVHRVLSRLSGVRYDGSPASRRQVVEALPVVALRRTP